MNVLLPLEESVLELGLARLKDGQPEFYGFSVARDLERVGGQRLTAHGTLYKVLDRLERSGLLLSRWEDPEEIETGRPRRRLYRVSDDAAGALARSRALTATPARTGLAAS